MLVSVRCIGVHTKFGEHYFHFLLFILSLITKAAYCFLHVAFVSLLLRFLLFSFGLVFSIKPSINLFDSIVLWFLCFRWTNIKICVGKWQTMSRFDWWAASSIFLFSSFDQYCFLCSYFFFVKSESFVWHQIKCAHKMMKRMKVSNWFEDDSCAFTRVTADQFQEFQIDFAM